MKPRNLLLLLGVGALAGTAGAAGAAGAAASTHAVTQVRGGHQRDGLLLLREQRQQQQKKQQQWAVEGPWARLMRVQGGIAQSKHAGLITETVGTGVITASAALLSKTDLPGSLQALAVGAVVMSLVYSGAGISGAQYNPAVSAILALLGKQSAQQAVTYTLVQVLGAVGGGFLAKAIAKSLPDPSGIVSSEANFIDAFGSFGLVLTALQTAVARRSAGNSYFGLAIGAAVTLGAALGAGMNPAVTLGSYAAGEGTSAAGLLPRCLVPILGGVVAALVFRATDVDEAAAPSGPLPSLLSASTVGRLGAYVNEFAGTGFLTGAVALALGTGKVPAPVAAGLALTALAFGGYASGAHLNPGVSLGVHLRNKARFPLQKVAGYSAAQTLGAVAAALGVRHFLGAGAMAGELPLPGAGYAWQHAFAAEATFTALLVSTVLHNAGSNPLGPLAIAAALVGGLFGASKISGGGLNPAAATALFVANGKQQAIKDSLWVYVLAPLVGAALGTVSVQLTAEGGK